MENKIKIYNRIAAIAVFVTLPILFYAVGDFPRRTLLKEAISVATIVSFFIMLMQFYLSRANHSILEGHKMARVVKWHKALGYIFVSILLVHPLLIVLPRYFEAGVTPVDAFIELIFNFNQQGLLLGLVAWSLMLIIGITSMFRKSLPFSYKTWRVVHGVLSIVFIAVASFHVIDMGRHINTPMIWLVAILAITGIALLLKTYVFKIHASKTNNHD